MPGAGLGADGAGAGGIGAGGVGVAGVGALADGDPGDGAGLGVAATRSELDGDELQAACNHPAASAAKQCILILMRVVMVPRVNDRTCGAFPQWPRLLHD